VSTNLGASISAGSSVPRVAGVHEDAVVRTTLNGPPAPVAIDAGREPAVVRAASVAVRVRALEPDTRPKHCPATTRKRVEYAASVVFASQPLHWFARVT